MNKIFRYKGFEVSHMPGGFHVKAVRTQQIRVVALVIRGRKRTTGCCSCGSPAAELPIFQCRHQRAAAALLHQEYLGKLARTGLFRHPQRLSRRVAVGHPNLQLQKPKQPGFRGRAFFLIDGGSFSATTEFAAVAHYRKRGIFIGQETGGGYHGNTSGMSYRLTLPHSKLQVSVPMIKYVSAVKGYPYPSRGIIPHYRVEPTIDDLISGKDPVMDFALARIRQTRHR